jgi:mRNA interferase MazF
MKRGEIYAVAGKGDFSTKPRPGLIVQSDLFNPHHPSVTVCPISSTMTSDRLFRISIARDEANGLREDSEVEVDKIQAVRIDRIRDRIGQASEDVTARVDEALRLWLDL